MSIVDRRPPNDRPDGASGRRRSVSRRLAPWVFAAIVVLAAALRLAALDVRPMHADEAVHATKFGRLLEQGLYEYDPEEFHGPTLYYLTLIPARVRGIARYAGLDEIALRSVPAVIGILLVAAHVLLVPVVGFRPAALAALLAAVSPATVYYSRYYIQETLLVATILGAAVAHLGWLAWAGSVRFASDPRNPWVYAHTGTGVFEIARRVDALSRAHPLRAMMPIEVMSSQNLWPLPWYLRRFSAVRWETAPVNDGMYAPVVLATPNMEDAIRRKLYEWRRPGERELYVPIFEAPVELRPQVEVRGYAAKTLWDEMETCSSSTEKAGR